MTGSFTFAAAKRRSPRSLMRSRLRGASSTSDAATGAICMTFGKPRLMSIAIGADLTREMLLEARAPCGAATPLVRADATALPIRNGVLDFIFGSHVFQFITDKDPAMRDLARCLSSGGAIILTIGGSGIREMLSRLATEEQWTRLARAVFPSRRRIVAAETEQVHRDAMIHAGLVIETRDVRFSLGWNGLVEWIDIRWSPFMDDEQRRIASTVFDELSPQLSSHRFDLTERLLIGRKAPTI